MGNAGRNGGEYYTPRPLIRAMIDILQPQIGETIYDGAAGSPRWCQQKAAFNQRFKNLARKHLLRQREKVFGLRYRHYEHDSTWHRST